METSIRIIDYHLKGCMEGQSLILMSTGSYLRKRGCE